jgi:hypothetical protein
MNITIAHHLFIAIGDNPETFAASWLVYRCTTDIFTFLSAIAQLSTGIVG